MLGRRSPWGVIRYVQQPTPAVSLAAGFHLTNPGADTTPPEVTPSLPVFRTIVPPLGGFAHAGAAPSASRTSARSAVRDAYLVMSSLLTGFRMNVTAVGSSREPR